MTDRTEFLDAVRAQAFVDPDDGCRIVHCLGSFTGADWDVDGVIEEIVRAVDVKWIDSGMDHDLAVLTPKANVWRFGVTRPKEES